MNDIDELLRLDAEEWNRAQPSPPDFDDALQAATAPRRFIVLSGRRRMTGAVGAVLVVAATVLVAVVVSGHRGDGPAERNAAGGQRPTAPASIVVKGRAIPYAGGVPWADAVVSNARSSSIAVYADGDAMVTKKNVCGLPTERAYVRESSTRVTILVAGYETPLPNRFCDDVGHGPQIQRLTLSAPLGRRTLVDATGLKAHPVLDASTVPQPPVPSRFTADPLQWDEKSGMVSRIYRTPKMTELIELQYGPASTITTGGGNDGTLLKTVKVGRSLAEVFRYTDALNDATTVRWAAGGQGLDLRVQGYPKQHLSVDAVVAMARSVH